MVELLNNSTILERTVHLAINIKNDRTQELVRELSRLTGESMTEAMTVALEERLGREKRKRQREGVAGRLMKIGRRCAARPVLDDRPADEILGYDDRGVPR